MLFKQTFCAPGNSAFHFCKDPAGKVPLRLPTPSHPADTLDSHPQHLDSENVPLHKPPPSTNEGHDQGFHLGETLPRLVLQVWNRRACEFKQNPSRPPPNCSKDWWRAAHRHGFPQSRTNRFYLAGLAGRYDRPSHFVAGRIGAAL